MARPNLAVSTRTAVGKGAAHKLRAAGQIPGVVYGQKKEARAVAADPKEVVAILHGKLGRNTPIDLAVEGESAPRLAIIRDYQLHPWKRIIEHVDLWEINQDTVLTITVPFRRAGRAETERMGAKVRQTRDDIVVACKPDAVPAEVVFDMSTLPTGDHNIHISEIPMPDGVTAVFKHDYSLIQLTMPRAKVEEAAAPDKKKGKK